MDSMFQDMGTELKAVHRNHEFEDYEEGQRSCMDISDGKMSVW